MGCQNGHDKLGKYCLKCDAVEYGVIGIGAGMTSDMIYDFGERAIALSCPCIQDKYLKICLKKDQVVRLSKGKTEQITEEFVKIVKLKDAKEFFLANSSEIDIKELNSLPPQLYD